MLVNRFEAVEIVIPDQTTLTRFYFPNLPNLTNALVDRIVLYNEYAATKSILTGGNYATLQQIQQTSITLYQGDLQLYYNLPLSTLVNVATVDSTTPLGYYNLPIDIDGMEISWTKSFISSPIAQANTNTVFSFGIFYHF
jgi:hypothetical protein